MPEGEIPTKLRRLTDFLDRHRLDGVLLQRRNNFAWITAGHDNHLLNSQQAGVAAILATRTARTCITNSIEAKRFAEAFADTGVAVVDYLWYDEAARQKICNDLIAGQRIATDTLDLGPDGSLGLCGTALLPLPPDFAELRWSLTRAEIARYRDCCQRATAAIETTCRDLRYGADEHEVAALLDFHVHTRGCNPVLTLVASDDRIERFRHPLPSDKTVQNMAMLTTCAEYRGLLARVTRFISFIPISPDLRARQQAVCNIDAAVILSTRPGQTLGNLFAILQKAYADNGHPDQWQLNYQGGPTGYAARDAVALPDSKVVVRENQAFAWNPSLLEVKSQDTILCTSAGNEVLTPTATDWPTVTAEFQGQILQRPDILVR